MAERRGSCGDALTACGGRILGVETDCLVSLLLLTFSFDLFAGFLTFASPLAIHSLESLFFVRKVCDMAVMNGFSLGAFLNMLGI